MPPGVEELKDGYECKMSMNVSLNKCAYKPFGFIQVRLFNERLQHNADNVRKTTKAPHKLFILVLK